MNNKILNNKIHIGTNRCRAKTNNGKVCKIKKMDGSDYCWIHVDYNNLKKDDVSHHDNNVNINNDIDINSNIDKSNVVAEQIIDQSNVICNIENNKNNIDHNNLFEKINQEFILNRNTYDDFIICPYCCFEYHNANFIICESMNNKNNTAIEKKNTNDTDFTIEKKKAIDIINDFQFISDINSMDILSNDTNNDRNYDHNVKICIDDHIICKKCIMSLITVNMIENKIIRCLFTSCNCKYPADALRKILDKDTYERYVEYDTQFDILLV